MSLVLLLDLRVLLTPCQNLPLKVGGNILAYICIRMFILRIMNSALSESLSAGLKPFNIRILLVEPGAFRTNFIRSHKTPAAAMNKDYEGTPLAASMAFWDTFAGKQPGDPVKAVSRILDVIQGSGLGENKTHLLRLPLGSDCFARIQEKLDAVRQNLEDMKEIALSTDVDSA